MQFYVVISPERIFRLKPYYLEKAYIWRAASKDKYLKNWETKKQHIHAYLHSIKKIIERCSAKLRRMEWLMVCLSRLFLEKEERDSRDKIRVNLFGTFFKIC